MRSATATRLRAALVSAAFFAAPGTARALDPTRQLSQYVRQTWAEDHGLPQNTISAVLQDHQGYLWLGTQEGLVRFDGVRFVTLDAASTKALPSSRITALLEDHTGRLWIGTDEGLAVREAGSFRRIEMPAGVEPGVLGLAETPDGTLWCGGAGGLLRFHDGKMVAEASLRQKVTALFVDRDASLWIGTTKALLHRDKAGLSSYSSELVGGAIRSFSSARDGGFWMGTSQGVTRRRDGAFQPLAAGSRSNDDAWVVREDREGTLWVANNGQGLLRFANGEPSRLRTPVFPDDLLLALTEDRDGNLWVGSGSAGLTRLSDGSVLPYGVPEGLPTDVTLTIFEAPDQTLWFGTVGGGALGLRKDGAKVHLTTRNGLPSDLVFAFHAGRDGSLWIATLDGLVREKGGRLSTYTTRDGLPANAIFAVTEDRDGQLWVGTQDGLAALHGNRFKAYGEADGLSSPIVRGVYGDSSGRLWVLTAQGVEVRDGARFVAAPGLPRGSEPAAFLEDSRGTIWFGSSQGLTRIDGDRISVVTPAQGLFAGAVHRILEDAAGDLWLSSNRGIFGFQRKQLDDLLAGRASRVSSRHLGRADGLRSVDCYGGYQNAGTKDHLGRLWFPTVKGAVAFDPAQLPGPKPGPPVRIESLLADGRRIDIETGAGLPPGPRQIQIDYTAFAYAAPEALRFRYRLEGIDANWQEAGARRTAYYTNLGHGKYAFRVMAATGDGPWSAAETRLEFEVAPRFYETSGFFAVVGFAILGLAGGAHRLRTSRLHRRQEQLEEQVHERTQDLEQAVLLARDAVREADTLRAATEALSHSLELQELLQLSLSELRKVVDYDSASVQELEGNTLRIIAGVGFANEADIIGLTFAVDDPQSPNGEAIRSRAPYILTNTDAYPPFRADYNVTAPILSWMGVPLVSGDRMLGLITLDKHESAYYGAEHARLALAFAAQAAVSIENARLFTQARRYAAQLEHHASELEQAANALKESEERSRAILETAHDAFVAMDARGTITAWNAQAEAIFGWRRAEAVGRSVAETIIPPEHRQSHTRGLERFLATGEGPVLARRLELTALHRDKHSFPVELTISAVPAGGSASFGAFIRDITERRRAEQRLRAQHAATRVLAEATTLAEAAPRILEALCQSFGWVFGAVWSVDPEADSLRCIETWHLRSARLSEFEARARSLVFKRGVGLPGRIWSSGESAWIADVDDDASFPPAPQAAGQALHGAFGCPVLSQGRVIGVLEFFSPQIERPDPDLQAMMASVGSQLGQYIERKQAEAAVVKARQLAEEASRAKSAFVASMSHELRTPLNAILGFVQLMERRHGRELEDREHLAVISRSGEHLLRLINEVLSLAKIESGSMSLARSDFDLRALLVSVDEMLRPRVVAKSLSFAMQIDAALPASVHGDEGKLQQILLNLLANAVKFTETGAVALRAFWHDGRARFEVEDTGPGLRPEEIGALFAAFSQTEAGRRRQEGTGLGLALSRSFARLMDGDVTVTSEPGRGSTFRVEIALPAATASVGAAARSRRVKSLEAGDGSRRILVADDDAGSRMLLSRLLSAVGFEVRAVANGAEAVAAWREWQPELIWMDMNMPVLDGPSATRAIREAEASGGLPRTPILALSASAFEHEREAVLTVGCDGFLAKPFRENAIFEELETRLGVRYVYEQPGEAVPAERLTRERLESIPRPWRERFKKAVADTDTARALALAGELEALDAPLADELRAWLRAYRLDELDELLDA